MSRTTLLLLLFSLTFLGTCGETAPEKISGKIVQVEPVALDVIVPLY